MALRQDNGECKFFCFADSITLFQKLIRKEPSYMSNLSGESRKQYRKDKVTRFPSVTYA